MIRWIGFPLRLVLMLPILLFVSAAFTVSVCFGVLLFPNVGARDWASGYGEIFRDIHHWVLGRDL